MSREALVRRNDYRVSRPRAWGQGVFTGNGLLGTMSWGDEHYPIFWELGRTDVMDRSKSELEGGKFKNNDCPFYRVPIGKLLVMPFGEVTDSSVELNLWDAVEQGAVQTRTGTLRWRTITHTRLDVIILDLHYDGAGSFPAIAFRPGYSAPLSMPFGVMVDQHTLNPPPVFLQDAGISGCLQQTHVSDDYATVWTTVRLSESHRRVYLTIGKAAQDRDAFRQAAELLRDVVQHPYEALLEEHRQWWHDYWEAGGVQIPDRRLEQHYYLQLYKFACATRADRPAYDLLGPWPHHTVWAATWWNLNIQLTYLPLYAANRLQLGESLLRMIDSNHPNLLRNGAAYGDDVMQVGRATDRDCLGTWELEWCNLPWVCHNYYLHARYSMDETLLERLYPVLRGSISLYLHLLEPDVDGILHLPTGISPEFDRTAPDTHINLALLRWGCKTLLELAEQLGKADPLIPRWREVLQKLAPYPQDEHGWMIGEGVPYDRSHRHFSHLLAFYPLALADWHNAAERPIIERSVEHWLSKDEAFAGYSWTTAACMLARMGEGERALMMLNRYLDSKLAQPNSMYLELGGWGGPTPETPASVMSALQDMLLQSHGGVVRIFPAVPPAWRDVQFHDLRTEGGFLISAEREGGETTRLRVQSEKGGSLRLARPWPGTICCSQPAACLAEGAEVVTLHLSPSESIELKRAS